MIHDTVNEVTTVTIQTSQFIHFRLRLRSTKLQAVQQDLSSQTGIKVEIFTAN